MIGMTELTRKMGARTLDAQGNPMRGSNRLKMTGKMTAPV